MYYLFPKQSHEIDFKSLFKFLKLSHLLFLLTTECITIYYAITIAIKYTRPKYVFQLDLVNFNYILYTILYYILFCNI